MKRHFTTIRRILVGRMVADAASLFQTLQNGKKRKRVGIGKTKKSKRCGAKFIAKKNKSEKTTNHLAAQPISVIAAV